MFGWFKSRRRKKILARACPKQWMEYLDKNVTTWSQLDRQQQQQLIQCVQIFVAEKRFEGCGGMQINDEVKVTIAGQACMLLLGIEHDYYRNVKDIVVYPSGYKVPTESINSQGIVEPDTIHALGQAWLDGPVILSWDNVRRGGFDPRDGHNLVYHEFAHKLDMLDDLINGTPPMANRKQYDHWAEVMTAAFERLQQQHERGRATLIDQYGTTNEAEFFAVATECFFEKPTQMLRKHPDLYDALHQFYKQHPAERGDRQQTTS